MAIEPRAKRMKLTKAKIQLDLSSREVVPCPVLADDFTREIQTVQAYAAEIKDRKQTSSLLRKLKDVFPLLNLGHLKRVKSLQHGEEPTLHIIVCSEEESKHLCQPLSEILHGLDLLEAISQPYVVDVPRWPPLTRAQFDEASKLWPVSFHEDKYISEVINGELFDEQSLQNIARFMKIAIAAAQTLPSKFPVGAVIVDPQHNHPIAVCRDLRCEGHPLQHAVMVCIDLVAHSQSKGAWQLDCKEFNGSWILSRVILESNLVEHHLARTPLVDSKNTSDVTGKGGCVLSSAEGKQKSEPYLCTGYDLYVTMEPCVMCAMALVHSRIRRVFYSCKESVMGGLGSRYKIHTTPGLNHHYEVFCGILEDECMKVLYGNK